MCVFCTSRRRHTRWPRDWSSDVCSSDLILQAAKIKVVINGNPNFATNSPLIENVLSMCMKEAVTNVVKHSCAKVCQLSFTNEKDAYELVVKDDGVGLVQRGSSNLGSG